MQIPILALGFITLLNAALGAVIFARTYKKLYGILFSVAVLSVVIWGIGDILLLASRDINVIYFGAKLFYLAPAIVAVSIMFFAISFPDNRKIGVLPLAVGLGAIAFWGVISVFNVNFIAEDITITSDLNIVTPDRFGFLVYTLHFSFFFFATYFFLFKKLNKTRDKLARSQITFTLVGVGLSSFLAMLSNLMLPYMGIKQIIWLGPILTFIYVSLISYAIAKHRLFDIRPVVARSIAYALTLAVIILVYATIYTFVLRSLIEAEDNDLLVLIINAVSFATAVYIYQPLKRFFDKETNKLFYRDAYDPQEFLDELNKAVVNNIELGILLRQATAVIEKHLKCTYALVSVKETDNTPMRVVGTKSSIFSKEDAHFVRGELMKKGKRTIVADELVSNVSKLKQILNRYDVAMIVRLHASGSREDQAIAYLMLGPKKSGNTYSKQDHQIIDIIADQLVIAIQNALRFEEIQGFAAKLQQEVNVATAKLRKTNEKLKALDETKDEFISMASHQLRTPLTSVKGYMSMVLEGDAGKISKPQRELLNQAFVSSQRMVYLIADLLNVSRLKTGKFVIESKPTNLAEVVQGEIAQLTEVAKGKNLTLTYKKPKDFPSLMLDETKIRQVVMNFADNAIYYTPAGGKIDIELSEDKGSVYFIVKDNGLGVPKAEQSHLFTKFYRAKNARKARPDGTGLGLFMAKKVINAQGGELLFESREGKGSTFGFTFKKSKLMPVPSAQEKTLEAANLS